MKLNGWSSRRCCVGMAPTHAERPALRSYDCVMEDKP